MENKITINEFISSIDISCPDENEFKNLSKVFPINPLKKSPLNYHRGILLYKLIKKLKPKNILEIGRAEGYSTLSMAQAIVDSNFDGRIYSIDPNPFHTPKPRITQWDDDNPEKIINLSTKNLWQKFAKKSWIEKIEVFSCTSSQFFKKNDIEFDFFFIDGHHAYESVLHDLHASFLHSKNNSNFLFDDYRISEGVRKVIDENVIPNFQYQIIEDSSRVNGKDPVQNNLVYFSRNSINQSFEKIFPRKNSEKIISEYMYWQKRWEIRQKLNKNIPFLKNIKFRK